jgi:hypothetical protein
MAASTILAASAILATLALISSCGNEPPTPGELVVTSQPSGATVFLDGVQQGITPLTIADLDGGMYTVAVDLTDIVFRPGEREIEVFYGRSTTAHFQTDAGILVVESEPAGAAILLDGSDTGEVTPHTFSELDPGEHIVDVALAHHRVPDGAQTIDVQVGEISTASFSLALGTVVLFEGFSNVQCDGCPAFLENVEAVLADPDHGFDKLVFVKFAGPVPFPPDPLYMSNSAMSNARANYYSGQPSFAAPSMYWGGELAGTHGTPPTRETMRDYVDQHHADPVDFYLTVTATDLDDIATSEVALEITVHAPYAAADLGDYTLRAVLVYEEVETAVEYDPGGDVYHWVARDDAEAAASIGTIAAGATATFDVTLTDPDPTAFDLTPHGRQIIVFAQHASDKSIIQAGSTMNSASAAPVIETTGGTR